MRRTGFRQILALVVAAVLVTTITPTAFAASSRKADGITDLYTLEDMFSLGQSGDYNNLEVYAGDEIRIPLTADMFTWKDGRTPLPMESVTTRELINSRVRVSTRVQSGNITLDYVQLETDVFSGKPFYHTGTTTKTGRTAYISIMLAEEFVSVKDQDFSMDVYVTVDGKSSQRMTITLSGTMLVQAEQVYKGEGYIDTSEGIVIEAMDSVPDFDMEIGQGIVVTRNLLQGQKYYATTLIKNPYDPGFEEDFPEIYPALEFVYKISSVNMRSGNPRVKLNIPFDQPYYVYGEDMRYLGRSNEVLAFSEYYFMSMMELPTLEALKYEDGLNSVPNWDQKEYDDGDPENPVTGGDEGLVDNANHNPSTGA